MSSGSSLVKDVLESYVAGRERAERLVITVAAAYYGGQAGGGAGDGLRPLIDVIDRASPGIVELGTVQGGAGFDIRLAERPFPKRYEAELRRAAEAYLAEPTRRGTSDERPVEPVPEPGLLARLVAAVRRLFVSSA